LQQVEADQTTVVPTAKRRATFRQWLSHNEVPFQSRNLEPSMTAPGSTYLAHVRAAEARFPRGGVWVFAAWYAVGSAAYVWGAKPSAALAAVTIAAFAAGDSVIIWVLFRSGPQAFHADADGLRLGSGLASAKGRRHLSWGDVQQLRISQRKHGVLLEVLVGNGAAQPYRSGLRQFADLAFMFGVPVTGVSRNTPALVVPRRDPPRYEIPLIQVTAPEVHAALAQVGASTVIAAVD
jgi:hypothetical protein